MRAPLFERPGDVLDAGFADRLVSFFGPQRDRLQLSDEDFQWGLQSIWTLGQVALITDQAQHEAYAKEINEILARAGAPLSKEAVAEFIRTREGARAVALMTRMTEWKGAGH